MALNFGDQTSYNVNVPRVGVYRECFTTAPAASATAGYDQDWDLQGTGGSATLTSKYVTLASGTGSGNEAVITGFTTSIIGIATWSPEYRPRMLLDITTPAAAANADAVIFAGFKKTSTDVIATDSDQCMFRYDYNDGYTDWRAITSISNTDFNSNTGVTFAASTRFQLAIDVDSDRYVRYTIAKGTGGFEMVYKCPTALTAATALLPFVGITVAAGGVTQTIDLYRLNVSMDAY